MPDQPSAAFISYSRADSEFALRLARDLKAAGAMVWLDQLDIRPGEPWDRTIEGALNAARFMLVILSPASSDSENVRNEITFALEEGKIVIPVLYKECFVPLQLRRAQRIDFRADYTRGLADLLKHLGVAQPDEAVLDQAAADEAKRHAAWLAREAEAQRLRELEAVVQPREVISAPQREAEIGRRTEAEAGNSRSDTQCAAAYEAAKYVESIPLAAPLPPKETRPTIPISRRNLTIAAVFLLALAGSLLFWLRHNRPTALPPHNMIPASSQTPSSPASPRTLPGDLGWVTSVAFSSDGRTLASGSDDNTAKLWDVTSGTLIRTLAGHSNWVSSVAFSPDGRTLVTGSSDSTIKLWDVASGTLIQTLTGHNYWVMSVAFSPDGRMVASGGYDQTVRLWRAVPGNLVRTLSGHTDWVNSVTFSPDGRTLASGSKDDSIKLWDVSSGKLIQTLAGHVGPVESVAFSPDGRTVASGSADRTIKLWNVASGSLIRTFFGHADNVTSVAFNPDGRTLASASYDKTIKLWDVASGTMLRTLSGHTDWVNSVTFSPDGRTLASGSKDMTIRLWDVSDLAK